MSKYIIDTDEWANLFEVRKVGVYGIGNDLFTNEKTVWSRMFRLDELEELNSDYISENFGNLQEEAYQRGLEDGKWKAEDGCDGCKYYEDTSLTNPCSECSRGHVDHYKPASDPDPIKVGDIVDRYIDGNFDGRGIYLGGNDEIWNCLFWANTLPITLAFPKEQFKMTGKHYDVQSILNAMKQ